METLKEIYSNATLLSTIIISITLYCMYILTKKEVKLPPGPKGYPFVGYLPFIFTENLSQHATNLQKRYGNVFGFKVGKHYCVILNDYKAIREGLNKKALLHRPPDYFTTSPFHLNFVQMNGEDWEDQRLHFSNTLRHLGIGKNIFEEIILGELSRTFDKLARMDLSKDCNLRHLLSISINNTIIQLLLGRWFEDDHPFMSDFCSYQLLLAESFSNNSASAFFPWLEPLLMKVQPRRREIARSLTSMLHFITSEVEARDKSHAEGDDRDYCDLFFNEIKSRSKKNIPSTYNKASLVSNIMLLLGAGTDTTRNTLEWLFMDMAQHQDIQEKVFQEVRSVLGERAPLFSDKSSMPYTEAVILESQRIKTLAPMNVYRWTSEDTVVQGYTIPKHSIVLSNLRNCHSSAEDWPNPETFNPERFVSDDKKRVKTSERLIPFSLGRRNCPGDKMAAITLFIYFAALTQRFKFSAPKGGVDFTEHEHINLEAVRPIVKISPRE